jgi:hypothetical protein
MSLSTQIPFQYPQSVTQWSGRLLVANSTSHSPYVFPHQHLGDVAAETSGDKCVLVHTPYAASLERPSEKSQPSSIISRQARKPKMRHKAFEDTPRFSASSSRTSERFTHNPYCLDNVIAQADDVQLHVDVASEGSLSEDTASSDPEIEKPSEPEDAPTASRHRGLSVVPPCGHPHDWKRLRFKKGLSHFVCTQCGLKWKSKGAIDDAAARLAATATTTAAN